MQLVNYDRSKEDLEELKIKQVIEIVPFDHNYSEPTSELFRVVAPVLIELDIRSLACSCSYTPPNKHQRRTEPSGVERGRVLANKVGWLMQDDYNLEENCMQISSLSLVCLFVCVHINERQTSSSNEHSVVSLAIGKRDRRMRH